MPPALTLEPYRRAVVVKGDTREVKDFLKQKGGNWNKGLLGWIFPGSKGPQLLADLRSQGATVEDKTGAGSGAGPAAAAEPSAGGAAKRSAPPPSEPAPAAKRPKTPAPTESSGAADEVVIDIADKLRGTVSSFMGSIGVDLRKFYLDRESGELRPGPKGVRLKPDEWQVLCRSVAEVDAALAGQEPETRLQATEELMLTIKTPEGGGSKAVDVRRFYKDRSDGEMKPGKKGVFLSQLEWSGLKASIAEISAALEAGVGTGAGAQVPAPRKAAQKAKAVSTSTPPKEKAGGAAGETASGGGGEQLRPKLTELLKGRDLQAVSLKSIRGELEAAMGMEKGALDSRREEVRGIVTDLLSRGAP